MKDPRHLAIRVDKETALGYDVRYLWSNQIKDLRHLFRVKPPRRSMTGTSCQSSVAHMNNIGSEALRAGGADSLDPLFTVNCSEVTPAEWSDAHSSDWMCFPLVYLLFVQHVHSGPSQDKGCAKCKIRMSVRCIEVPRELLGWAA